MTDPIKDDQDLTQLQRDADRQKSPWAEAEEADGTDEPGDAPPSSDSV